MPMIAPIARVEDEDEGEEGEREGIPSESVHAIVIMGWPGSCRWSWETQLKGIFISVMDIKEVKIAGAGHSSTLTARPL